MFWEIWLISYIVYCFLFGLLGGCINEKKGCSYWTGFWCGFLLGIFGILIIAMQKDNTIKSDFSPADELKKYKELLDKDIITQEEFEAKKKELLNLK